MAQVIIANDERMAEAVRELARLAAEARPVLVHGESGAGAGTLCMWAHETSTRRGPLVIVNPGAIPAPRHEAELFGDGGAIARARRGTLLVRMFHELEPSLQRCVLAEAGDARVVATVCTSSVTRIERLEPDIRASFAGVIAIPPLRERPADLEPLALHFWSDWAAASG